MSLVQSKPTRNADYRHAQSLGRQRKHTGTATPREQAETIAKIVRKRMADGQPAPDVDKYRLDDDVWSELLDILTADELSVVGDACGGDHFDDMDDAPSADDITRAFDDDDQQLSVASQRTPSWRDHEPAIVHSLKWHDADGIEHLHIIRADGLDEALRHIKKVKLCIATAKAQTHAADTKEPGSVSPRRCAVHDAEMTRRVSKKTGKLYSAHDTAEGLCFGRKA